MVQLMVHIAEVVVNVTTPPLHTLHHWNQIHLHLFHSGTLSSGGCGQDGALSSSTFQSSLVDPSKI